MELTPPLNVEFIEQLSARNEDEDRSSNLNQLMIVREDPAPANKDSHHENP